MNLWIKFTGRWQVEALAPAKVIAFAIFSKKAVAQSFRRTCVIPENLYGVLSQHKTKSPSLFVFKDLATTLMGWQMGLEPTTFRTTI